MLRGGTFNATTSAIGRESGEPDFVFHVFDLVAEGTAQRYDHRMANLEYWKMTGPHVAKVLPVKIANAEELAASPRESVYVPVTFPPLETIRVLPLPLIRKTWLAKTEPAPVTCTLLPVAVELGWAPIQRPLRPEPETTLPPLEMVRLLPLVS